MILSDILTIGFVNYLQHSGAFGANETSHSYVDISRAPLTAVEAALVGGV